MIERGVLFAFCSIGARIQKDVENRTCTGLNCLLRATHS